MAPKVISKGARKPAETSADRLLLLLAGPDPVRVECGRSADVVRIAALGRRRASFAVSALDDLIRAGLVEWWRGDEATRRLLPTDTGRARVARLGAAGESAFQVQHADLRETTLVDAHGALKVTVNDAESPLAWLYRRKGPDGAPLISATQFAAGERLRAELTRAQIMPRVTANWSAAVASGRRGADPGLATDAMIAARQRVDRALEAAGAEFAGLLIDVCGFLKRLPEIERERVWPARSAKLVLDMALTRLARHYGLEAEPRRDERALGLRFWGASGYRPAMGGDAAE